MSSIFLLANQSWASESYFDIESLAQDYVLETKQIFLSDFPEAFNASIVRWQGRLLMCFRILEEGSSFPSSAINSTGLSHIGIVWLDSEFNPISNPQILKFGQTSPTCSNECRADDARLVTIGDTLYLVYSDNRDKEVTEGGFRVYLVELEVDGDRVEIIHEEPLLKFEDESPQRREKNWVPFDYNGEFLLAYSLNPHKIFLPELGAQSCQTVATTWIENVWPCGELRGGTPAIKIDDEHYLAFFHSSYDLATEHSDGKEKLHYFMGAYLFSATPPFSITHISEEPIVGKNFYHGKKYTPYWKPVCVVFPCGQIVEEDHIWVSYGRQDHEIWICKLDKRKLLDSLQKV